MKVYICVNSDHDGDTICGVFDSMEKAEAFKDKENERNKEFHKEFILLGLKNPINDPKFKKMMLEDHNYVFPECIAFMDENEKFWDKYLGVGPINEIRTFDIL